MQEIESQAINAQREINVVKGAVSAKQRDIRLLELTNRELKVLPKDTKVYEGVGKMYAFGHDVFDRFYAETKIFSGLS